MQLINIGFGNMVAVQRLVAIVSPDSAPIKRMVQEGKEQGIVIDASYGRKTQGVIIMDNDHLILSALSPEIIASRIHDKRENEEEEKNEL